LLELDEEQEIKEYNEYVEGDEMNDLEGNKNKSSIRSNKQKNQRRFSRMTLGTEKSISKNSGFTIKWGVNVS